MFRFRENVKHPIDFNDLFFFMSEGNPGALNAMMTVFNKYDEQYCSEERGGNNPTNSLEAFAARIQFMKDIDDMNIRGEQIHILYKYVCDYDVDKMLKAVKERDEKVVEAINYEMFRFPPDIGHVAVTRGASKGIREVRHKPHVNPDSVAIVSPEQTV